MENVNSDKQEKNLGFPLWSLWRFVANLILYMHRYLRLSSLTFLRTCCHLYFFEGSTLISRYPNALVSEETETKTKTLLLPTCSPSPTKGKNFWISNVFWTAVVWGKAASVIRHCCMKQCGAAEVNLRLSLTILATWEWALHSSRLISGGGGGESSVSSRHEAEPFIALPPF